MRTGLALLLAGVLAPTLACAAPILVRTGEHDGFTRVVIDFRDRPDWSLEPEGNGVVLRTEARIGYDLGGVYRRIRRERIAGIEDLGGGDLRIGLDCACDLRTFELSNQGLVIDVRDGDGRPEPRLPRMLETEPQDLVLAPGLLRDIERGDPFALLRRARLAQVRANVGAGVDRAVAQGVTRPSDAPRPVSTEVRPEPGTGVPDLSAFDNIRVGTLIDRDRNRMDGRDAGCPAPESFAIDGWGDADLGIGALSAARARIFADEDGPDPAAVRDSARRLLYVTFGLEAAEVLRLDGEGSREGEILAGIAAMMDGGAADEAVFPFASCGGAASMWALVGGQTLPERMLQSALGAYDGLPPHLRRHLGPRLARRLLAQGHAEEARLVERAMERGRAAPDAEVAFATAEISAHDGREADARVILEDLATSGLPQAGAAMADLLASLGTDDEAAPNALIDQAKALSFELDGAVGTKLDGEITLAMGRNGRFGEAMSYLYSRDVETGMREDIRDDLYDMVLKADDILFVETAARLLDGPRPGEVETLAMASRLAGHGLVVQARAYLDGIAGPPRREERLIRARLAKIDGDAESAETYLAGMDGVEAEEIRDDLNLPPRVPLSLDDLADTADPVEPPLAGAPSVPQRSRTLLAESAALREALAGLTAR